MLNVPAFITCWTIAVDEIPIELKLDCFGKMGSGFGAGAVVSRGKVEIELTTLLDFVTG